jgi:hypothetical protein
MHSNSFWRLMRDYTAIAKRTGKSMADRVDAALQLRAEAVRKEAPDQAEAEARINALIASVAREYGVHDHLWQAPDASTLGITPAPAPAPPAVG